MPALASPVTFKPLIDARLRYEAVEQFRLAEDVEALPLRAWMGGELGTADWSFLVEAEGTLAIVEDYNSGLNGFV